MGAVPGRAISHVATRVIRALLVFALLSTAVQARAFEHSHFAWNALLGKHVVRITEGRASQLSYAGMVKDRKLLAAYLDTLSAVPAAEFAGWSRAQQMAFLANAYNAFTVEKVLTRYPGLGSIQDFGRVFGNPFKDEFFSLLGRKQSLDGIEHGMLRKKGAYDEPRVHFALNCASIGCPMLREEAYVAERIDAQLEDQAKRFLSDRSRNRFASGRLEVSKIFDWYKEDFMPRERYFARYAAQLADSDGERKLIADGKAAIVFLDYDWTLNDFPSSSRR
jgi:hypothetical protein